MIIPRNTVFPCHRMRMFTTVLDGQKDVVLRIFEGESPKCYDNVYLGQFSFDGLNDNLKAGSYSIEICFDIDGVRNLTVSCKENVTERVLKAVIDYKWL